MKSFFLLLSAVLITTFTREANGLNPTLKQMRAAWNPEEPYNSEWLDEVHNYLMELSDA